jgi:hypothetical protein
MDQPVAKTESMFIGQDLIRTCTYWSKPLPSIIQLVNGVAHGIFQLSRFEFTGLPYNSEGKVTVDKVRIHAVVTCDGLSSYQLSGHYCSCDKCDMSKWFVSNHRVSVGERMTVWEGSVWKLSQLAREKITLENLLIDRGFHFRMGAVSSREPKWSAPVLMTIYLELTITEYAGEAIDPFSFVDPYLADEHSNIDDLLCYPKEDSGDPRPKA